VTRLPDYANFPIIARRIRWDPEAIDLSQDAAAWSRMDGEERSEIGALLAGFLIGETAVAADIRLFGPQAGNDEIHTCFTVQAGDEERHRRFFERVHAEVLGASPEHALAGARRLVAPRFVELFEGELKATAARVAADRDALIVAVGLYHGLLEGVVFLAGQDELLERLDRRGHLPGIADGVAKVQRDERWHVAFGARLLADAGGAVPAGRLHAEGRRMIAAWGTVIGEQTAQRILSVLERRLRVIGAVAA
jgi:ribonucleoside-diphosphate reductase beta chain